jgi:predicted O-methyltransferase YrrM
VTPIAASHQLTWNYADQFIPETEAEQQARRIGFDLGLEPLSRGVAQFLTFLAATTNAKTAVEITTGCGIGTLALLRGMGPQGMLTSLDAQSDHHMLLQDLASQHGIASRQLRLIAGRPLEILSRLSDAGYDLVTIDGAYLEYPEYFEASLRLLRPGGTVVLHHALLSGTVADDAIMDDATLIVRETIEAARSMRNLTTSLLPIGDGLLLVVKNR